MRSRARTPGRADPRRRARRGPFYGSCRDTSRRTPETAVTPRATGRPSWLTRSHGRRREMRRARRAGSSDVTAGPMDDPVRALFRLSEPTGRLELQIGGLRARSEQLEPVADQKHPNGCQKGIHDRGARARYGRSHHARGTLRQGRGVPLALITGVLGIVLRERLAHALRPMHGPVPCGQRETE